MAEGWPYQRAELQWSVSVGPVQLPANPTAPAQAVERSALAKVRHAAKAS